MKHHRFTNSTGTIAIRGTDSGGSFKSKLERDAFIWTSMDAGVASVHLQQPRISYLGADGKKHRYTGDLLVQFHAAVKRRPLIIECKYAAKLERDQALREKLKRVRDALNHAGRDFIVQTECDIHAEDFRMKKFVFSHRNNDPHPAQQEILDCIATHKSLSLRQLIQALRTSLVEQCALVPEVWRLVSLHQLAVNFKENLDLSAKINLPSV